MGFRMNFYGWFHGNHSNFMIDISTALHAKNLFLRSFLGSAWASLFASFFSFFLFVEMFRANYADIP